MDFEEFVLAAVTSDLSSLAGAREYADAVEFRTDLASGGVGMLAAYDGDLPLLVTNRLDREGGEAAPTPERLDVLCRAIEQPAVEAVDVELSSIRKGEGVCVVRHARERDVAVVVSAHDFDRTPDRERLREILSAASDWGTVAKLAVTAKTRSDVLDLLAVTRQATADGERVATMAMGEPARHSRVVAPLYGSRLGYAPLDAGDATAPGQYDLETFRRLYEDLRDRS